MDIALLIQRFGITGGAEGVAAAVARRLRERGHRLHVYAAHFAGEVEAFCTPHPVPRSGRFRNRHVAFARDVRRALERHGRHDVVYSFTRTLQQDILRLGGGIHAEYLRCMAPARSPAGRLWARLSPKERAILELEREGLAASRLLVAVSQRVKREAMEHYGVPAERIEVLHNGVDLERFQPRPEGEARSWLAAAGVPDDGLRALFVGSGFRRKGLPVALAAVAATPGARLLVCGGDRLGPWQGLAARLGVGARVHWLGLRRDVEQAYRAAHLLLLPALYDPFPNVCLEAMASGCPVAVSPVCGPSEVIRDGCDSYVADGPAAFAECLRRLQEPDLRRDMGQAARATAERHPLSAYVSATLELLGRELPPAAAARFPPPDTR